MILTTKAEGLKLDKTIGTSYPIYRVLHNHYTAKFFPKEIFFDIQDINALDQVIREFKPDLIYSGHIYPLTKQLLPYLSTLDIPIVCDEGGNSLKGAWTDHGRWFRLLNDFKFSNKFLNTLIPVFKKIVLWISRGKLITNWTWPESMAIIFNSNLNFKNAAQFGVPVQNARVIHSGVDLNKFSFRPRPAISTPIRIIIPGRIEQKKGQIDGVRLINELHMHGIEAELIITGSCSDSIYAMQIEEEIKKMGLQRDIVFQNMVSQEEIAALYQQCDVCFFSSYHQSGFSRVPLEAMACGCIVTSYGNEGSDEIIKNEENGFLIAPGDIWAVAELVTRLVKEDYLVARIIKNARDCIEINYSLPVYISQIEEFVKQSL